MKSLHFIKKFLTTVTIIFFFSQLTQCVSGLNSSSSYYPSSSEQFLFESYWDVPSASKLVKRMGRAMLAEPWLGDFLIDNKGKKPTIYFNEIGNLTSARLDTDSLGQALCLELQNSKKLTLLTGDSGLNFSANYGAQDKSKLNIKKMQETHKFDFFLEGYVTGTTVSQDIKKLVIFQIEMRLFNAETTEPVWVEVQKLRKEI